MGKRSGSGVAIACAVTALLIVPSARGATEVGSKCVSNASVVTGFEGILFPLQSGSLPASAPVAGIATQWIARKQPGPDTLYERLKVLRPTTTAKEVEIVAESPLEGVSNGHETFAIRIPVQAGDRFGLSGPLGALACTPAAPGESSGSTTANGQPGTRELFFEATDTQAAVSAVIESDLDDDGYGDETQDGCPEYASIHTACPFVRLTPSVTAITKRAILLNVFTGDPTQVQVNGQVGWNVLPKPSAPHGGRKPDHAAGSKARVVVPLNGGTQEVPTGTTVPFTVPLPKAVRRHVRKLAPRKKLKAKLRVISTDLVGHLTLSCLTVRLPGPEIVVTKGTRSCPAATLPG